MPPASLLASFPDYDGDLPSRSILGSLGELILGYQAPPGDCKCDECEQQYRSLEEQKTFKYFYAHTPTKVEASTEIRDFITSAEASQKYLQAALRRHGTAIVDRWKRRTRAKRRELLKEVEPNLSERLWNYFDRHAGQSHIRVSSDERPMFLLPYLSYERLAHDPMMLLSLLHHRSSHSPKKWFPFDLQQTKMSWETGYVKCDFSHFCVAVEGSNFGELVGWSTMCAHSRDIIGFPRAKLAFEAQHTLLRLLKNVVAKIITQTPEVSSIKWGQLVDEGFVSNVEGENGFAFSNAAFSSPATFDTTRLVQIAKGQLQDADDDMWLLQTDPVYFQKTAKELALSNWADVHGKEKIYDFIGSDLPYWFLHRAMTWKWVFEECSHVDSLCSSASHIASSVNALEMLLSVIFQGLGQNLMRAMSHSHSFNHMFTREKRDIHGKPGVRTMTDVGNLPNLYKQNPLFWALLMLTDQICDPSLQPGGRKIRFAFGLDVGMLFDFAHTRIATASHKERAGLSHLLLVSLSDLATVHELLSIVASRRPKSSLTSIDQAYVTSPPRHFWRRSKAHIDLMRSRGLGLHDYDDDPTLDLSRSQIKLLEQLTCAAMPTGKINREWPVKFDNAHKLLREFWKEVRVYYHKYLSSRELAKDDHHPYISRLSFGEQEEHRRNIHEERQSVVEALFVPAKASKKDYRAVGPPSAVDTTNSRSIFNDLEPKFVAPERKEKLKTRGEAPSEAISDGVNTELESLSLSKDRVCIELTAGDFRIFKRMFQDRQKEQFLGTVHWRAFVKAMIGAGFSDSSNDGSAVAFSYHKGGRVVVHKPHPVEELDQIDLRIIGKRLNRWFGFSRDTFVCRK